MDRYSLKQMKLSNTPLYSMAVAFKGLEFLGIPVFIGSGEEEDFYILKEDPGFLYVVLLHNNKADRYSIELDGAIFDTSSQKLAAEKMTKLMLLL